MFSYDDFVAFLEERGDEPVGDPENPNDTPIDEWLNERYGISTRVDADVIWEYDPSNTFNNGWTFHLSDVEVVPTVILESLSNYKCAHGIGCTADDHYGACTCGDLTGNQCLEALRDCEGVSRDLI